MEINEKEMQKAAEILRAGGLVAFPTETVYGLGGDAFNPLALAKIFEIKKRPRFDPLIIHIADLGALEAIAEVRELPASAQKQAERLMHTLWPGPLTLILPKKPALPDLATSGLPTVGVRLPAHPEARKLIRLSTGAIAAPSANPFGYLSPTTADHVRRQLGEAGGMILDGGPARIGLESTVLDLTSEIPRILRPGGTPEEILRDILGDISSGNEKTPRASPGMLKSHYAPGAPLKLHDPEEMLALPYNPEEGYLFFRQTDLDLWLKTQDRPAKARAQALSAAGDLPEAGARLFGCLRELDSLGLSSLHAERVPDQGLGKAINDRLSRGSAGS
ncbi:MAG: threonylcarbamoyl-AMP synthase [Spirochaetaceae bacterium]|jgi:L-threonylcarbamoyladenylate synthase|nr:threonylcarbamoyl-AMP synthase [Spirochaetaceae bacterium]